MVFSSGEEAHLVYWPGRFASRSVSLRRFLLAVGEVLCETGGLVSGLRISEVVIIPARRRDRWISDAVSKTLLGRPCVSSMKCERYAHRIRVMSGSFARLDGVGASLKVLVKPSWISSRSEILGGYISAARYYDWVGVVVSSGAREVRERIAAKFERVM